jgi:hypothetical protein
MSEKKICFIKEAPGGLGHASTEKVLSEGIETGRKTANQTFIEKFRLIFGFFMLVLGLYFGVFSTGIGVSLGFLSFLTSPFVMVTDK